MTDGTTLVCRDCGYRHETTEAYPTLAPCRECGSRNVEDEEAPA